MARSGLQARRRADSRQDIIDAARELVLQDGAGAMTLSAVAARVGVTTPALYHYFDSKKALLQALVYAGVEAESDMLVATAEGWSGDEAGIVGGIVRAMYDHYRPNLAQFRLIYLHLQVGPPANMGVDEGFLERIHPLSKRMFDALEAVLTRGRAAGRVAEGLELRTAVVAAHAAAAGLLTMLALADRAADPLRQPDDSLVRSLSELLTSGVRER